MNPAELDKIYKDWHNHALWAQECLTIPDKRGRVVPLRLSPGQAKLSQAIAEQEQAGQPIRIIYLKARQVHVSVGASSELFHRVPFHSHQHGAVIAHEGKASAQVFSYYEHFARNYKPFRGLFELPEIERAKRDWGMEWANGSYVHIHTANNLETGRSFSLRYLHLDEYAFWRNASRLMTGLMNSVPDDPGTCVLKISTANGMSGQFYEDWLDATNTLMPSGWKAVFFAWWEHPEYAREPDEPMEDFMASLRDRHPIYGDEETEMRRWRLSPQQMAWRRWAIRNKCHRSLDKFRQEYPAYADEAFLMSGRRRFNVTIINQAPVIEQPLCGVLEKRQMGVRQQVIFQDREHGPLAIFRRPDPRLRYAIGADTAEGIDAKTGEAGDSDPDYSVACLLDENGEQVAQFRDRVEPAIFAEWIYALGEFYNWAYLVPEVNSIGIATLQEILRLGYPRDKIFTRRAPADVPGEPMLNQFGFRSTTVTRPQLISTLDTAILENAITIRDRTTVRELNSFVVKPNGKAEAANGAHDDAVIALGLAVIGVVNLRHIPQPKGSVSTGARIAKYGDGRRRRGD